MYVSIEEDTNYFVYSVNKNRAFHSIASDAKKNKHSFCYFQGNVVRSLTKSKW